jgi:hypothetical protein
MSKKKAKHGKGGTASHSGTPATRVSTVRKTPAEPTPRWMIPFLLVISFLVYLPILKAGFVNWDDMDYVYENGMIRDLSQIGLLLTTPVQGNYHPLTMLSLAINYAISGLDAGSYHLFNLAFHLINVYLVFRLARLLSRGNSTIAFATSLLFALHPMHVESVAWISERKDVLYALFFIAGLISYTRWIDTGSKKMYGLTFVFLLLSLLSKPAAVIFPSCFFLLIYCANAVSRQVSFGKRFLSWFLHWLLASLLSWHKKRRGPRTCTLPWPPKSSSASMAS